MAHSLPLRYDYQVSGNRDRLLELARRYVWWSPPDRFVSENRSRIIAQVMEIGTWEDAHALLNEVGRSAFVNVLRDPPPGGLSTRSQAFWHHRLGLGGAPGPKAARRIGPERGVDAVHG
ncbi:MAG TPA: hypothetical protein VG274_04160 [Rhizomicrobium sp.]|nr:hypothetical protein [Rhizomicrobium sp.]